MLSRRFAFLITAPLLLALPGMAHADPAEGDLPGIWYVERSMPAQSDSDGNTVEIQICGSAQYLADRSEFFSAEMRVTLRVKDEPRAALRFSHQLKGRGQWSLQGNRLEEHIRDATLEEGAFTPMYDGEVLDATDFDDDARREFDEARDELRDTLKPVLRDMLKAYDKPVMTEITTLNSERFAGTVGTGAEAVAFEAKRLQSMREACR